MDIIITYRIIIILLLLYTYAARHTASVRAYCNHQDRKAVSIRATINNNNRVLRCVQPNYEYCETHIINTLFLRLSARGVIT